MRLLCGKSAMALLMVGYALTLGAGPAHAQFFNDDFGSAGNEFSTSDDVFTEDTGTGDGFTSPPEDYSGGGEFVEEGKAAAAGARSTEITIAGRRTQLRLVGEKEQLPFNGAWGAGTGLLIGGWIALINDGSNRETQRSIGLGIVLGTLVGLAVGTKSLIAPNAPQPVSFNGPAPGEERAPLLAYAPPPAETTLLHLQLRF